MKVSAGMLTRPQKGQFYPKQFKGKVRLRPWVDCFISIKHQENLSREFPFALIRGGEYAKLPLRYLTHLQVLFYISFRP